VVAIELDPRLADQLRGRGWSNVEVIEADAVGIVLPREPFRVLANVPFGRANDLEISVSRRLPPNAFDPPPSVAAGVLVFRRRDEPLVRPELDAEYRGFVAHGFRRGLRAVAPPTAVSKVSERGAIPRELDAFQWAALFDVCHSTRE
jgi:16S rRNA A1518/A1519 N6-dimethyltransferase RsmA/KsgA/DIM1 with predicted DNA glycosylase/AP lyase activity